MKSEREVLSFVGDLGRVRCERRRTRRRKVKLVSSIFWLAIEKKNSETHKQNERAVNKKSKEGVERGRDFAFWGRG